MKALPWIIAGVGVGIVAYAILNQPEYQYGIGTDEVEGAALKTAGWGARQRVTGTGTGLVGKLKEGAGRLTGNDNLSAEGIGDQVVGSVKDAAGTAAHAVAETIHDLNK